MNVRHILATTIMVAACYLLISPSDSVSQPEPKKNRGWIENKDGSSKKGTSFDKKQGGESSNGSGQEKKDPGKGGAGPSGTLETRQVVKNFDKDGDNRLNTEERAAARVALRKRGGFGKGGGGFGKGVEVSAKPGARVSPADVPSYPDATLYEPSVLRTLFLEFENRGWEAELADFKGTDVDVPATLIVDGKKYPNVGVHFRGMTSYLMVPTGSKRSLNLALDFVDDKQRLYGYKTLNLLNSHEDSTLMSAVLYSHIARQYAVAPKANFVKLVINGESWGIYANVQQFNKEFLKENFQTDKGTRWKVRGSPNANGGLEYFGEKIEEYKRRFEIKSADDEKSWKTLINLCKVLNQTPPNKLEEALKPILDIDSLLWFLALDVALINCDGYWVRASDYSLYLDEKGIFHVIPHDMNEAFRAPSGPGFGGPASGGGGNPMVGGGIGTGSVGGARPIRAEVMPTQFQETLRLSDEQRREFAKMQKEVDERTARLLTPDQNQHFKALRDGTTNAGAVMPPISGLDLNPMFGMSDERKPLRGKVLAVPSLRARYLQNVRTIAEKSLDWKTLGPVVAQFRKLIEKEVEADTKKLSSFEAFIRTTADEPWPGNERNSDVALRTFADQRRNYLLSYRERQPKFGPGPKR